MDITNSNHLIVFVKNPELGKVKTRLAAGIGNTKALEVYEQLLEVTKSAVLAVDAVRNVFYSDRIENDNWLKADFVKHVQNGADLGERMSNAFQELFDSGAKKVIVIGSDCPQISGTIIKEAFQALDKYDAVIGPAKDGGYYLLGMKKPLPFLFENKMWSTDSVLEATVSDFTNQGLKYYKLETLSDLDIVNDLHLLNSQS